MAAIPPFDPPERDVIALEVENTSLRAEVASLTRERGEARSREVRTCRALSQLLESYLATFGGNKDALALEAQSLIDEQKVDP